MKHAPGVVWPPDMHPKIVAAIPIIDQIHTDMTGEEATCTSAFRPETPGGGSSCHPKKQAIDLRTWAFGDATTEAGKKLVRWFAKRVRERLGKGYDFIVEGPAAEDPKYLTYADGKPRAPHTHLEWDPE